VSGNPPAPRDPAILYRAAQLAKIYGSGTTAVHALHDVDLAIRTGAMVVLLGPSGSGKSTLLNILGGLDRASAGAAWFGDCDLCGLDDDGLTEYRRANIGFVFQFYNLIASLTARENVQLIADIASDPMAPEAALALVGLENRIDRFPAELSGGEQQRVAIARAVAKRPRVLLCDEPTGALDSKTGTRVLAALDRINREVGTTTLIITHNAVIADMADDVIRFHDGTIASVHHNAVRCAADALNW
jgi:putative ABC transport system ATP-binding protein